MQKYVSKYYILLFLLTVLTTVVIPVASTFAAETKLPALPNAEITAVNCDVEISEHARKNNPNSCFNKGITADNMELTIHFEPSFFQKIFDGKETVINIKAGDGEQDISNKLFFKVQKEGDSLCAYARLIDIFHSASDKNANYKINKSANVKALHPHFEDHCVYATLPKNVGSVGKPKWSTFLSPVCTNYDNSASHFRFNDTSQSSPELNGIKSRSFTGVVVQCIEDTMMNLFSLDTVEGFEDGSTSIFSIMQDRMKDIIRGLLALYIIFFAFQFIIEKKTIKQAEWQWFALKAALVMYFAAGPGMTQILPALQDISKGLSLIVMEASFGNSASSAEVENAYSIAKENYNLAAENLAVARYDLARLQQDISKTPENGDLQAELERAIATKDIRYSEYKDALQEYNFARGNKESFGYKYCDFRDIEKEDPNAYINKPFMKLWDTVDCKLATYLGTGIKEDDPRSPYLLVAAIASFVASIVSLFSSTPLTVTGALLLPFSILTMVLLIFIILLVVRVINIYIIALVALILLIYMSPLIIPAVLFGYTKSIFDKWLSQVISYTLQPVIMFVFLSLTFAAFDFAMYGGNNDFVPMTKQHTYHENKICVTVDNARPCSADEFKQYTDVSKYECDDPEALGCFIRKMNPKGGTVDIAGMFSVLVMEVSTEGFQTWQILVGLLKMILIAYLSYALLGFVESFASTVTNAVSSASGMSSTPKAGPKAIAGAAGAAVGKAANASNRLSTIKNDREHSKQKDKKAEASANDV